MTLISLKSGNLLDSDAQALVNTVNCVGVMGKGIALDFKNKYPSMFRDYVRRCKQGEVRVGEPYLFVQLFDPWIINFPTKNHWRSPSRLEDIDQGLACLARNLQAWEIQSIAIPPLGCGNGQLEWKDVGPMIVQHLAHCGVEVQLYTPPNTPDFQLAPEFLGITELE